MNGISTLLTTLTQAFAFPFFVRALVVGSVLAVVFGIVGVFVVLRREANVSHALSGFALTGVAVGWFVGSIPVSLAVAVCVMIGVGIIVLLQRTEMLSMDSLFESLGHIALAVSVILVSMIAGYRPDLNAYLFGDVLAVSQTDIITAVVVGIGVVLAYLLWGRVFLQMTLSPELARSGGVSVRLGEVCFLIIVGIAVIAGMRVLGVLLTSAALILPANIAKLWSRSFRQLLLLSVGVSVVGMVSGLILSYLADTPSGATIVVFLGVLLLLSALIRLVRTHNP